MSLLKFYTYKLSIFILYTILSSFLLSSKIESFKDALDARYLHIKEKIADSIAPSVGLERKRVIDTFTAEQLAEREALRFGLNPAIMRALVHIESRGDGLAESPAGARGAGQVMPANAKRCGLRPGELFNPALNLKCSAQILSEEMKTYSGDVFTALMAYNCSPKAVKAGKTACVKYAQLVLNRAATDIR